MRRQERADHGAIAVVVALCSVLMFSVAALAVDLGNAYARKRDVQGQADFAALAAGAGMSNTTSGTPSSSDPAVQAAAQYLVANWPQDDAAGASVPSVSAMQGRLTNALLTDGQACYGSFPAAGGACLAAAGKFTVLTPETRINYGFARVMTTTTGVSVTAKATVEIQSPATGVMPSYAVSGCDYGPQTITDPAAGQTTGVAVPALADFDSDTTDAITEGISTSPTPVPLNPPISPTPTVTISGKKLDTTTKVGFFRATGSTAPTLIQVAPTSASNGSVTAVIPTSVSSVEAVWYVRVYKGGTTNKWSARVDAQPLRIGNAVLECAGVSNDGNFGTLLIPRTSNPSDWLATNMAAGLQSPLSLAIYPGGINAPVTCSASPAIVSDSSNLRPGTNCVDTDTGLPANSTTSGLITGVGSIPGRLNKPNTVLSNGTSCGSDSTDRTKRWDTGISITGNSSVHYTINDDVLTCFLTDSSTTLNTIVQPSYGGAAMLSPDIFKSPRFMWVPVLKQQPSNGGSSKYSIIDFRPAFLSDQPLTATKATMAVTSSATSHNGITIKSNSVSTAKLIFFNVKALPETVDSTLPTTAYLGVGPKIVRLTD